MREELKRLLAENKARVDAMTDAEVRAMFDAQAAGVARAEATWPRTEVRFLPTSESDEFPRRRKRMKRTTAVDLISHADAVSKSPAENDWTRRAVLLLRAAAEMIGHAALTAAEQERLAVLAEESAEAVQAAMKIMRHGYASRHPEEKDDLNNRDYLTREIADVSFAARMMIEAGDVVNGDVDRYRQEKREKVVKYLHHNSVARPEAWYDPSSSADKFLIVAGRIPDEECRRIGLRPLYSAPPSGSNAAPFAFVSQNLVVKIVTDMTSVFQSTISWAPLYRGAER